MKIVSWNCRGLGGTNKVEEMKDIIKSKRPDILPIQETIMSDVEVLVLSHLFWTNNQGNIISSRGASGGIMTLFSSNYVIKNVKEKYGSNVNYV